MASWIQRTGNFISTCIFFIPLLFLRLLLRTCVGFFKFLHDSFGSSGPFKNPYDDPTQVKYFITFLTFLSTLFWLFLCAVNAVGDCWTPWTIYNYCYNYPRPWYMDILRGIGVTIIYFIVAYAVIVLFFIIALLSCALAKRSTDGMNSMVQDIVERRRRNQQAGNGQQQQAEAGADGEREPLIPNNEESGTGSGREGRNEAAAGSLV